MKYEGHDYRTDFRAFHEAASNREHKYGELLEQDNVYYEDFLEKVDIDHLLEGLTEYLRKVSADVVKPEEKARFIILEETGRIESENFSSDDIEGFRRSEERFKAIKGAVEKGLVWDFNLEVPWHPELFKNPDHLITFPYQHRFMVGYSAKPKHIFFSEEGKEYLLEKSSIEEFHNPESTIEQGRLRANRKDYENDSNETLDSAIYFSNLIGTRNYPVGAHGAGIGENRGEAVYRENVVLEIEVPTNFVIQFTRPEKRWENTRELKKDFDSPEAYMQEMDRKSGKSDVMDFKLARKRDQEEGEVFLPLKYIVAVWDREISPKTPFFIPFDDYVSKLQNKYPGRVPGSSNSEVKYADSDIQKVKNEYVNIRRFQEDRNFRIDQMRDYLNNFRELRESQVKSEEDVIKSLENILEGNKRWNHCLENLNNLCKGWFETDSEISQKEVNAWDIVSNKEGEYSLEKEIQRLDKIIEALMKEEKERLDEIKSKGTDSLQEDVRKLERKVIKEVSEIPIIKVQKRDRRKLRGYVREKYNISEKEIT